MCPRFLIRLCPVVLVVATAIPIRPAHALTINAESCSEVDVRAAVSRASAGDTIVIPPGNCTWTEMFSIDRGITLQGAGVGSTIIRDGKTVGPLINWRCEPNTAHRLTGIEFQDGGRRTSGDAEGVIRIRCTNVGSTTFRIDNNKFEGLNGANLRVDTVVGLIDHNEFITRGGRMALLVFNPNWNGSDDYFGDRSWSESVTWGGPQNLFVEGNTLTETSCVDGFRGMRAVFRFNTFTDCHITTHGTESSGRNRGGRAVEIYKNTYINRGSSESVLANLRSGSALVWGNAATGLVGTGSTARLLNGRATWPFAPFGGADKQSRGANGTNPWDINDPENPYVSLTASRGDGLEVSVSGAGWTTDQWRGFIIKKTSDCTTSNCHSVIRSNTADTITFYANAGYGTQLTFAAGETFEINRVIQIMDGIGRGGGGLIANAPPVTPSGWNDQVTFPFYEWFNTNDGLDIDFSLDGSCIGTCRENEHFYNYDPTSFDGSSGVGSGLTAGMPPTCTPGVWYWATDDGEWWADNPGPDGQAYECTSTNTWTVVYTPFTYPHPLTTGPGAFPDNAPPPPPADLTAPSVPANLSTVPVSSALISLSWTASTDNVAVTGYRIFRNGALLGTTSGTNFADGGLTPSTLYTYRVSAIDAANNESAQSAEKAATTLPAPPTGDATPPSVPTITAVTAGSTTQINLSWTVASDNVGVTGYRVFRNGGPIGTTAGTTFSDTGLTAASLYTYTVTAFDSSGNESAQSTPSSATTLAEAPPEIGTAPQVVGLLPADNATGVALNTRLTMAFDRNVFAGAGNIQIHGGLSVDVIPVSDPRVSIAGSTVTITPAARLAGSAAYNVLLDPRSFTDSAGNAFAGVLNAFGWNFWTTVADDQAPVVSILAPWSGGPPVSGTIAASATARDNVGVGFVQILLDGVPVDGGSASYTHSILLDTLLITNGAHTLTANATDWAGNVGTLEFPFTVDNGEAGLPEIPVVDPPIVEPPVVEPPIVGPPVVDPIVPVDPNPGAEPPGGPLRLSSMAIEEDTTGFAFTEFHSADGILLNDAPIPSSPERTSGTLPVNHGGAYTAGVAFSNQSGQPALVDFHFTDAGGVVFGGGSVDVAPNSGLTAFFSQPPFNLTTDLEGSFVFSSSVPVGVAGLRGLTNDRDEFVYTTVPVAGGRINSEEALVPIFAAGDGWTSEIVLTNTSAFTQSGKVDFLDPGSEIKAALPQTVTVNGKSGSTFPYSIPAGGSARLTVEGSSGSQMGTAKVTRSIFSSLTPDATVILTYSTGGTVASEASFAADATGTRFRSYVESSFADSIQTGIVFVNPAKLRTTVEVELFDLDGVSTGLTGSVKVPARGQAVRFIHSLFPGLTDGFRGFVRATAQTAVGMSAARVRSNNRGDILVASTPPTDEARTTDERDVVPLILDGAGFSTEVVTFEKGSKK